MSGRGAPVTSIATMYEILLQSRILMMTCIALKATPDDKHHTDDVDDDDDNEIDDDDDDDDDDGDENGETLMRASGMFLCGW